MFARALENEFAEAVRQGLTRAGQKTLPCSYLYDDVGSALFEAITCLQEYGLTRADARLIQAHAKDTIACLPRNLAVVELGSGTGVKTRAILEAARTCHAVAYYPIDVSATALARCVQEMEPLATVAPLRMSYLDGLREAASRRQPGQSLLVLFLGSTIGNFEPEAAIDFLYAIRGCLEPRDALLLGTDLVKPAAQLVAAYDDPAGVTAAFNLNLLARINRELAGDFALRQFEHVAVYCEGAQRIEMHLRARTRQVVTIPRAYVVAELAPGETIFTEACHKFRTAQVRDMARSAGFEIEAQWIDTEWPFAENLLIAGD